MKQNYTIDHYTRAMIRSAISTINTQFNSILAYTLPGCAIVNANNHIKIVDNYKEGDLSCHSRSHRTLNNAFFLSNNRINANNPLEQAYLLLSHQEDYKKMLLKVPAIIPTFLNPVATEMVKDKIDAEDDWKYEVFRMVREGEIAYAEMAEELKKHKVNLNPEKYVAGLKRQNMPEKDISKFVEIVDILNKNKDPRMVDYLDTYTMFHYYKFRQAINRKFVQFENENPKASKYLKMRELEDIINEQIKIYCNAEPSEANNYYNNKLATFGTSKMSSERAKMLVTDIVRGEVDLFDIASAIEYAVNENSQQFYSIDDIVIKVTPLNARSETCSLKKPVILRSLSDKPHIATNIEIQKAEQAKKEVVVPELDKYLTPREKRRAERLAREKQRKADKAWTEEHQGNMFDLL